VLNIICRCFMCYFTTGLTHCYKTAVFLHLFDTYRRSPTTGGWPSFVRSNNTANTTSLSIIIKCLILCTVERCGRRLVWSCRTVGSKQNVISSDVSFLWPLLHSWYQDRSTRHRPLPVSFSVFFLIVVTDAFLYNVLLQTVNVSHDASIVAVFAFLQAVKSCISSLCVSRIRSSVLCCGDNYQTTEKRQCSLQSGSNN